jgi:hypothetical protein
MTGEVDPDERRRRECECSDERERNYRSRRARRLRAGGEDIQKEPERKRQAACIKPVEDAPRVESQWFFAG